MNIYRTNISMLDFFSISICPIRHAVTCSRHTISMRRVFSCVVAVWCLPSVTILSKTACAAYASSQESRSTSSFAASYTHINIYVYRIYVSHTYRYTGRQLYIVCDILVVPTTTSNEFLDSTGKRDIGRVVGKGSHCASDWTFDIVIIIKHHHHHVSSTNLFQSVDGSECEWHHNYYQYESQ